MPSKPVKDFQSDMYFAVSPLMIFPRTLGRFRVYIRQAGNYVLYAAAGEQFTPQHRQKLHDAGVGEVYIRAEQRPDYENYVETNLPHILADEAIPTAERAQVLYTASQSVVRDVFESRLPRGLAARDLTRVTKLVEKSLAFLAKDASLRCLAALTAHDYTVYTHNVQVFVYTIAILHDMKVDEATQIQAGIGALLHDIGKTRIPKEILAKPGPLTPEERAIINTHPVVGLALCQDVALSATSAHCILLHHERMDGSGYPGGLSSELIPSPVRALAVADVYDALTSDRVYAPAMPPFSALRLIRDEMVGYFDMDVYKRLVMILSGANVV
jgi:HD-GYP domain-containing protein (c-di-GMP phosphodiesterase class II)